MEPKRLTDDDLRAIRARMEAATPGPWTVEHEMKYDVNESTAYLSELHLAGKQETVKIYCGPGHAAPQVYDLVFLAYARADIPALLAHADALAAEVARLREERELWELALKAYAWDGAWDSGRRWMGPEDGPLVARRALEGGA